MPRVSSIGIASGLFLVIIGLASVSSFSGEEARVYVPSLGALVGSTTTSHWKNRTIYQFQGIPYAEPPSGNRRFRPPEPAKPWTGELNATRFRRRCPQEWAPKKVDETTTSPHEDEEDCLTLNIYTANTAPECSAYSPVMFYIHGGSWRVGSATDFKPNYIVDKDIVLVVIQYRLGPLGFLSLQTEDMPGNAGLLDQVLALRWVKKHITGFCGDPNKITIFGSSAGAASVTLLMISPLVEKDLFHQAIFQSGSALATWVLDTDPVRNTRDIAAFANCTSPDLTALAACLRKVSPQGLLDAHSSFLNVNLAKGGRATGGGGNHAVIQVAGSQRFLVEDPRESLAKGRFKRVPIMGGVTKHEGTFFLGNIWDYFIEPRNLVDDSDYLTHNLTRVTLEFSGLEDSTGALGDIFREKYFTKNELGDFKQMTPGLVDICGVTLLKACTFRMVQENSRVAPSYLYSFNFKGTRTKFGYGYETNYPFPGGIAHSDDLIYLFPDGDLKPDEDHIARMMTDLWTNFATNGEPAPTRFVANWPPVSTELGPYLRIDSRPKLRQDFLDEYTIAITEGLNTGIISSSASAKILVVGLFILRLLGHRYL